MATDRADRYVCVGPLPDGRLAAMAVEIAPDGDGKDHLVVHMLGVGTTEAEALADLKNAVMLHGLTSEWAWLLDGSGDAGGAHE